MFANGQDGQELRAFCKKTIANLASVENVDNIAHHEFKKFKVVSNLHAIYIPHVLLQVQQMDGHDILVVKSAFFPTVNNVLSSLMFGDKLGQERVGQLTDCLTKLITKQSASSLMALLQNWSVTVAKIMSYYTEDTILNLFRTFMDIVLDKSLTVEGGNRDGWLVERFVYEMERQKNNTRSVFHEQKGGKFHLRGCITQLYFAGGVKLCFPVLDQCQDMFHCRHRHSDFLSRMVASLFGLL